MDELSDPMGPGPGYEEALRVNQSMNRLTNFLAIALLPSILTSGCASQRCRTERLPAETHVQTVEQKWVGYEIIGSRRISRPEIIQAFPLSIGSNYSEEPTLWMKYCQSLQARFNFIASKCDPVKYLNGDVYMVIDVVEKGEERRNNFRVIPDRRIELVTPEIQSHFDDLYKRLWSLFAEGKAASESGIKGYLDYDDPEMHLHVLELVKVVPPLKTNILSCNYA